METAPALENHPQPLFSKHFFRSITIRSFHPRSNSSELFCSHQRLQASCNRSPPSISSDLVALVHDHSHLSSSTLPLLYPFDLIHPTTTHLSSDALVLHYSSDLARPTSDAPRTLLPISHPRRNVVDFVSIVTVRPLN